MRKGYFFSQFKNIKPASQFYVSNICLKLLIISSSQ